MRDRAPLFEREGNTGDIQKSRNALYSVRSVRMDLTGAKVLKDGDELQPHFCEI